MYSYEGESSVSIYTAIFDLPLDSYYLYKHRIRNNWKAIILAIHTQMLTKMNTF